jgi:hypothetical protein
LCRGHYLSGCGARLRLEEGDFKPAICETLSATFERVWNILDDRALAPDRARAFHPRSASVENSLTVPSFIFHMSGFAQAHEAL